MLLLQVYVSLGFVVFVPLFFFARARLINQTSTRRDVRQGNTVLETVNKELRRAHYIPFIV
jgi:hypothetical protein